TTSRATTSGPSGSRTGRRSTNRAAAATIFEYDLYNGRLNMYRGAEPHGITAMPVYTLGFTLARKSVDCGVRMPTSITATSPPTIHRLTGNRAPIHAPRTCRTAN